MNHYLISVICWTLLWGGAAFFFTYRSLTGDLSFVGTPLFLIAIVSIWGSVLPVIRSRRDGAARSIIGAIIGLFIGGIGFAVLQLVGLNGVLILIQANPNMPINFLVVSAWTFAGALSGLIVGILVQFVIGENLAKR
jgi:hypothetical protein